jgi:tRNA nucleotidyltransferase (CCA-adding enzyme)
VRRWLARVGPGRVVAVIDLAEADARAQRPPRDRRTRAEVKRLKLRVAAALAAAPPLSVQDLALDGRAVVEALGDGPGPHVGEALRHLLDRVLADPGENDPEKLRAALHRWWAARPSRL